MTTAHDSQSTDSIELTPPDQYLFTGDISTVENKRKFIEAFRAEGSVYHAAQVVGIHRTTVYKWLEADAEFGTALDDSREDCYDQAESSVFRKALAGDSLLLMFYLKAHRPKFRDKVTIDVEVVKNEIQERIQQLGLRQLPMTTTEFVEADSQPIQSDVKRS